MFLHLHIASSHYALPTTISNDITNIMCCNSSECNQSIQSEKNVLSVAYQNSILQVLTAHGIINNQDETKTILQKNMDDVQTELQSHDGKILPSIYQPEWDIRQFKLPILMHIIPLSRMSHSNSHYLLQGYLCPSKRNHQSHLSNGDKCNCFLHWTWRDWVDKSGNYSTDSLCNLHQSVFTMEDISMNTWWSDEFEAHQVKGKKWIQQSADTHIDRLCPQVSKYQPLYSTLCVVLQAENTSWVPH